MALNHRSWKLLFAWPSDNLLLLQWAYCLFHSKCRRPEERLWASPRHWQLANRSNSSNWWRQLCCPSLTYSHIPVNQETSWASKPSESNVTCDCNWASICRTAGQARLPTPWNLWEVNNKYCKYPFLQELLYEGQGFWCIVKFLRDIRRDSLRMMDCFISVCLFDRGGVCVIPEILKVAKKFLKLQRNSRVVRDSEQTYLSNSPNGVVHLVRVIILQNCLILLDLCIPDCCKIWGSLILSSSNL